jgi:hypothetical protein
MANRSRLTTKSRAKKTPKVQPITVGVCPEVLAAATEVATRRGQTRGELIRNLLADCVRDAGVCVERAA